MNSHIAMLQNRLCSRRLFLKSMSAPVILLFLWPLGTDADENNTSTKGSTHSVAIDYRDAFLFPFMLDVYLTTDISPQQRRVVFLNLSNTNYLVKLSGLTATQTTNGIEVVILCSTLKKAGDNFQRTDDYSPTYEISLLTEAGKVVSSNIQTAGKMKPALQSGPHVYHEVPPIEALFTNVNNETIHAIQVKAE